MKPRVALLIAVAATVACTMVWLMHSPKSEVLVSSGIALGPQWQEIHPNGNLQTKSVLSELLLQMPSQQIRQIGNELYLGGGTYFTLRATLSVKQARGSTSTELRPLGTAPGHFYGYKPLGWSARGATIDFGSWPYDRTHPSKPARSFGCHTTHVPPKTA